ncbi:MAG: DegT/DnrJ/EryC1/StrS family aminotransferase [Planctomycetota bacterium]
MSAANPGATPTLSRSIPYVDLGAAHRKIKAELLEACAKVIDHGVFVLGPEVAEFEARFAELCGVEHAVACNSGTDAWVMGMQAMGLGGGDEVICPPNSFVATASGVALAGATPTFSDIDATYNLDPAKLDAAVTAKTKAISVVHLTGRAADMTAIQAVADKHGLAVIEDAAQAVLAEHKGQRVGSFGRFAAFSLHPLKTLNACGDGGVLTTDDGALAAEVRLRRNLGLESREQCVFWSGHSRLDTMQAAMLLVKLNHVGAWTEARRRNAARYDARLAEIDGVTPPPTDPHGAAVYHTYVIQAERRDALQKHLAGHGVGTGIHYPIPIHQQKCAAGLPYAEGSFPVAEAQAERILTLPVSPEIDDDGIDYVCDRVADFYRA